MKKATAAMLSAPTANQRVCREVIAVIAIPRNRRHDVLARCGSGHTETPRKSTEEKGWPCRPQSRNSSHRECNRRSCQLPSRRQALKDRRGRELIRQPQRREPGAEHDEAGHQKQDAEGVQTEREIERSRNRGRA